MGDGVLFHPQTTIGAQDLMVIDGLSHYGVLRKYGKLERIVSSAMLLKFVFREVAKWRQKFVVLSKGCLYVYKDEFSTSPFQCQSLRGYDKVQRLILNNEGYFVRYGFKVLSEVQQQRKQYTFGCATEKDRKTWMKMMRKEIKLANAAKMEEQADDDEEIDDEYIALETRIYYKEYPDPTPKKGKRAPVPLPKEPEDSDEEDDYDKVDEKRIPPTHRSLPALPTTPVSTEPDYKNSQRGKPVVAKKPKKSGSISKDDFEFQGSDRDEVQTLLRGKTDGTFLVRQSRTSASEKVLAVQTDDGVKEYKIYVKGEQLSIDNKVYFNDVEKLLIHYKTSTLPNRPTRLARGYSEQDLRVT